MPTVPRAQQQVSAAPLPGARVTTQAPEGAFGGPDLSGPTRALASYAAEERDKADQVAVNGAVVQAHDLREQTLYDPQTGALNQKGANALGSLQTAREAWQSGVSQISGSLQNDRQREAFAQHAVGMYEDLSSRIESHAHDEFQREDKATTDARLGIADKDALDNVDNPERLNFALQQKRMIVADYGKRQGWSPEAIQSATTEALSGSHKLVVQHLTDTQQDLAAKSYFAAHRAEMSPDDTVQMERLTKAGSVREESRRLSTDILGKTSTLGDALTQAESIPDAQTADATVLRLRQHYADMKSAILEQRAEAYHQANAIVQKTGRFENIPLSLRIDMSPDEVGSLRREADRISNPDTQGDDTKYLRLLNLASMSPASQQEFMKKDILGKDGEGLSTAQKTHLLTLHRGMLGGDDGDGTPSLAHMRAEAESEQQRTDHLAEKALRDDGKTADAEQLRAQNILKRDAKFHHGWKPDAPEAATAAGGTVLGATPGYKAKADAPSVLGHLTVAKPLTPEMLHDLATYGEGYAKVLRAHNFAVPAVLPTHEPTAKAKP